MRLCKGARSQKPFLAPSKSSRTAAAKAPPAGTSSSKTGTAGAAGGGGHSGTRLGGHAAQIGNRDTGDRGSFFRSRQHIETANFIFLRKDLSPVSPRFRKTGGHSHFSRRAGAHMRTTGAERPRQVVRGQIPQTVSRIFQTASGKSVAVGLVPIRQTVSGESARLGKRGK